MKAQRELSFAAAAALLAGILAALNVLASALPLRLDLSRGRIYSLTPASKELVSKLEDPVLIRAYFSRTLPPQHAASRRYLESFLREYRDGSRGMVRFEFVDVEGERGEAGKKEALADGVSPLRFNVFSRNRFEAQEGMMGLTLRHVDQKETIPVVADVSTLEYELTSRIRRMTRAKKPVLGFASGVGAAEAPNLPDRVQESLSQNYELKSVDLKDPKGLIPEEVRALWVIGPEKLDEKQRYVLDQFLLSGRTLAVAADTRKVDLRNFFVTSMESGLAPWLAKYGARLESELVLDKLNQKVSVTTQQGWLQVTNIVDYPPLVQVRDLDREHPATRELQAVVLPFVSPIEVSSPPAGVQATVLARSSPQSWLRKSGTRGFSSVTPFQTFEPEADDRKGPFTLAVSLEGRLPTAFDAAPAPFDAKEHRTEAEKDARLLVLGTARFIRGDTPPQPANLVFFLNLTDWMLQEPALIGIRSKSIDFAPLEPMNEAGKTFVKHLNLFGPSLLAMAFGVVRWRRRLRWKASRPRAYGLEEAAA